MPYSGKYASYQLLTQLLYAQLPFINRNGTQLEIYPTAALSRHLGDTATRLRAQFKCLAAYQLIKDLQFGRNRVKLTLVLPYWMEQQEETHEH